MSTQMMCYWIRSVRHVSATLLSTKRRRLFQAHCQLQHAPIRPGSRCTHGTVTQLVALNIEGEQPVEQARVPHMARRSMKGANSRRGGVGGPDAGGYAGSFPAPR